MSMESASDGMQSQIYVNFNMTMTNNSDAEVPVDPPLISTANTNILEQCRYPRNALYEHNLPASVICISFIFLGVIYSLFGYRCFKLIMFLTGCIFGTSVVYYICTQDSVVPQYAIAGVALGAGILFGLITTLMQYVGLFMTGFHSGLLLCVVTIAAADTFDHRVNSLWTSVGMLMGFAVLFALLTLACKKSMTIFGSCLFGGALLAASLDYFVEKLVMVRWMWEKSLMKNTIEPCWLSWIMLSVWPSMMMMGLIVQCAITGRGVHHEKSLTLKKTRNNQNVRPRSRDQRAEMKQNKYRYLYQVRTAHGDVISQSYVQALQGKVIPGMMTKVGESSTLQSDATHLTTLPLDQSTQLPSSECNTVDSGVGVQFDGSYYHGNKESIQTRLHDHCR